MSKIEVQGWIDHPAIAQIEFPLTREVQGVDIAFTDLAELEKWTNEGLKARGITAAEFIKKLDDAASRSKKMKRPINFGLLFHVAASYRHECTSSDDAVKKSARKHLAWRDKFNSELREARMERTLISRQETLDRIIADARPVVEAFCEAMSALDPAALTEDDLANCKEEINKLASIVTRGRSCVTTLDKLMRTSRYKDLVVAAKERAL
jgi:hypothetical protein